MSNPIEARIIKRLEEHRVPDTYWENAALNNTIDFAIEIIKDEFQWEGFN